MNTRPNAFQKFMYQVLKSHPVTAFFAPRIHQVDKAILKLMKREIIFAFCLFLFACSERPAPTQISTSTATTQLDVDVEMESAFQEARNSLDVFIQKIGTPDPNRTFVAVKVRFSPPDGLPQDIWVDEVTYADGSFRGNMGDDIPSLRLEAGEKINIQEEDILDWMIVQDGKLIGGYTIRVAVQRMSPDEKERFLETLDYSIED